MITTRKIIVSTVILLLLCLVVPSRLVYTQGPPTEGDFVPPTITHPDEIDQDFNGIEDALEERVVSLSAGELEEMVDVMVILKEPYVDADLDLFTAMGGEIRHTYEYVTYGFSGSMPIAKIGELAEALGERLNCITEAQPLEAYLDISTQIIGVRELVWETYGYRGDPDWAVAVLDSGIDDSHPDLSGYQDASGGWPAPGIKIVGWEDIIGTSTTPEDYHGHGTHVASIVAGTGAALGSGPISEITTTFSGKLPQAGYGWSDRIELPMIGNISLSMTWAGSGQAWLRCHDPSGSSMGEFDSDTPPLEHTYIATTAGVYQPVSGNYDSPALEGQPFSTLETYPYEDVEDGNNLFTGVAPESRLVGVRIFPGTDLDVVEAYDWVVANRNIYRIKVTSSSVGLKTENLGVRNAANNVVENGIVFVVAAGNNYPDLTIKDPGLAAKVITVAGTNDNDGILSFSSNGAEGSGKPDVAAPGGSHQQGSKITAVDTNDSDGTSDTFADRNPDDYTNLVGTSLSAPHVAGAAALVIQAMEDVGDPWSWTESEALKVKSIILMTACETNDGVHPGESENHPSLDRGGRDLVEGYGRICADAAIEAVTMNHAMGTTENATLGENPTDKRVWARQVDLSAGQQYDFSLSVPADCDFDLYLYSSSFGSNGDPIITEGSTGSALGEDESITYTPPADASYYVVVKWVSGSGEFGLQGTTPNTPPEVSNVTASQSSPIVDITYDVDDTEQSQVSISFEYWDGSSWHACITTTGEGTQSIGTGKSGTWNAKTDFDEHYMTDCKIRVTADDEQAENNIGTGESDPFTLDTKDPTGYGCDTPANGATAVSINPDLTCLAASDDSPTIYYYFQLAENDTFSLGLQESGWQSDTSWSPSTLAESTQYWWKVKAKDSFENEGGWCTAYRFSTIGNPAIGHSPASFTFIATYGGSNPDNQTLEIWNSGSGILEWSVSDDADWLTLSPADGTSTGEHDDVTLSVDITGMSPGSHDATITIEDPEATNSPVAVPVELHIIGDDHGDSPETATHISVGDFVLGDIETSGDVDFFSFSAQAGAYYIIETTLGTLGDSCLHLYDTDGTTELDSDDDSGEGLASRIEWIAPSSGTYFIKVRGYNEFNTGSYGLYLDGIFFSPDLNAAIGIFAPTEALDAEGNPLEYVSIEPLPQGTPEPPAGAHVIGLAYDFGPGGATFAPPVPMVIWYDPAELPSGVAEEDLVIAYYDAGTEQWVELDSVVDTEFHSVSAWVSDFTAFAITGAPVLPAIGHSPTSFTFNATEGEANPDDQTLSIWNAGVGTLEWSVSDDADWLTLSPASGISTGETHDVTLSVDITGMSPGSHDATITIEDPEATNSPVTVPVELNIIGPPAIGHSPTSFTFNATEGGANPDDQTLEIWNAGGETLHWSVSDDADWLSLAPPTGTSTGETHDVTLSVDITGMVVGSYDATITIEDPEATNSPVTVPVELNIAEPAPTIGHSPTSFTFNATEGGANPDDQTLGIWNSGGEPLHWLVSDDADWFTLAPPTGISTGETDDVTLSVDITGMVVGSYDATITIEDPEATNSPVTVPVELHIIGDDHGDSPETATHISVGYSVPGDIEAAGDADFFSFSAQVGATYTIENDLDTLIKSALFLYDSEGALKDIGYDHIEWIAESSDTYFIKVMGGEFLSEYLTGTYALGLAGIFKCPDDQARVEIPAGTEALDAEGNPLEYVSIEPLPETPAPPAGAHVIGLAYDFGPDGATFVPPILIMILYDLPLPEGVLEKDLVIAYYDTGTGQWVELYSEVDTGLHIVSAWVSHLTPFAVYRPAPPPPPPRPPGGGGGGGGGPPSGPELEVNLMGRVASESITEEGELEETIDITSRDGEVRLCVDEGTVVLDSEGNWLEEITINRLSECPEPPESAYVIGSAYDFEPDGAAFDGSVELTICCDPEELPERVNEEELVIAYYHTDSEEWRLLASSVADTAAHTVTASISHLTIFAIVGREEAGFDFANYSISSIMVDSGESVTISVEVTNSGGMEGTCIVTLLIDGVEEASQEVRLGPGASDTVIFATTREAAGTYSVEIHGLTGEFAVKEDLFPWALVGGIMGGAVNLLVVAAIVWYLAVRRRRRAAA